MTVQKDWQINQHSVTLRYKLFCHR